MPNIKATKAWLWDELSISPSIPLARLHETYEKTRGTLSEAVLFLSVLHVANEKNLFILELPDNGI